MRFVYLILYSKIGVKFYIIELESTLNAVF